MGHGDVSFLAMFHSFFIFTSNNFKNYTIKSKIYVYQREHMLATGPSHAYIRDALAEILYKINFR